MPQAENNEIPYNTSDGSSFPVRSIPRVIPVGASTAGRGFLYFWVAVAVVLGIVALYLITYKTEQKATVSRPARPPVQPSPVPRPKTPWQDSYSSGLALAKKEGKMQMLYFYTEWCGWCQKMEKETFADRELSGFLNRFITVKINGDRDKQTLGRFAVSGYPTLVFTDHEGNLIEKFVGYLPANSLREKMQIILSRGEKASQGERQTQEEKPQTTTETPQNIQATTQREQPSAEVGQEKNIPMDTVLSLREKASQGKKPTEEEKPQDTAGKPQNIQAPAQAEKANAEVRQEKNIPAEVASPPLPNNESPIRYHELAHSYEKQGDLRKATEFFRRAVQLAPDDWRHRRCFGMLLIRTGNFSEAISHLERASELNPRDPEIFHQLGHTLWKTREYQRSMSRFEKAIQIAPDNQQYSACAAKAYYLLGIKESNPNLSRSYLKRGLYLISKVSYSDNTPRELKDLKFQISRAYSDVAKKTLPRRLRDP